MKVNSFETMWVQVDWLGSLPLMGPLEPKLSGVKDHGYVGLGYI